MTYNVDNIHDLFDKTTERINEEDECMDRFNAIKEMIVSANPHLLGMVEAPPYPWENEYISEKISTDKKKYQFIEREKYLQGEQSLVIYYSDDTLELLDFDTEIDFYSPWTIDIDNDSIEESIAFERIPLEAQFRIRKTGQQFMVILAALKSKLVAQPVDIIRYQTLHLANRKKILAQAKKLRTRLDILLKDQSELPVILMGDINDSPELDSFEKHVGISAVETIMGSVFKPDDIFRNVLSYQYNDKAKRMMLYTLEFLDPIVHHTKKMRRVWLDHILLSPHFFSEEEGGFSYSDCSGKIHNHDKSLGRNASDHLPVYCDLSY